MDCWTMPQRMEHLNNLKPRDILTGYTLQFQGRVQELPVYVVPVALPCYRLANGRTRAAQAEYKAKNGLPKEFFDDPDSAVALDAQHELLIQMVNDKNLLEVLRIEQQTDPLILDDRGYVINGNRRLCAMRKLLSEVPLASERFRNVRVVILPTCTDEDIRELEAQLQIKPDTKAEYTWVDLAMMQRSLREGKRSDPEIAKLYGIRQSTVVQSIEMLSLAEDYLSSRGWEGEYSRISGSNKYAFSKLLEGRTHIVSASERDAFTQLVFLLVDDPAGGRLYDRIPDLADNLEAIVDQLKTEMEVPVHVPEPDPLFGNTEDRLSLDCAGVVEMLEEPDTHDRAREVTKNEVERIDRLAAEDKGARFCLKRVAEAHTMLEAALSAFDQLSVTKGILAHLGNIESLVTQLRQKVDEHDKSGLR